MTDQKFLKKVEQANTPKKVLSLILENEDFLGYDPYYADLRKAMLQQAQHVWETKERDDVQQAEERRRQADKERGVRFYCEKCGEELWYGVDWHESYLKTYTLEQLMTQCVCSDCTLTEIHEDREKEREDDQEDPV